MREIHIFYVQSNFHLIIANSIIKEKRIPQEDVYFIPRRKINIPDDYKILYDECGKGFRDRIRYYFKNKSRLHSIFNKSKVCVYEPFNFLFPNFHFFDEQAFYEEGLSSYASSFKVDIRESRLKFFLKLFVISILFPFSALKIKGFLVGTCGTLKFPIKNTDLFVCSEGAYNYLIHKYVRKKVLNVCAVGTDKSISDSVILVLDRLSANGRPFDLDNYIKTLSITLGRLKLEQKRLYVKMHPADRNSDKTKEMVKGILREKRIVYDFYDENLDDLALNNKCNLFVGSNSTTLFYAPIFGNTNSAVSFVRLLAQRDSKYSAFLERWGGLESFCKFFSLKVNCIS